MTSKLADIDVAKTQLAAPARLDRVGMSRIECPVIIATATGPMRAPAVVDAFVSLDEPQKGIHMSRLFLSVEKHLDKTALSPKLLVDIAQDFLASHHDISRTAHIRVTFDLMIKRPALVSSHEGWRSYPISLWATVDGSVRTGAQFTVKYSSTCPCSAALSRQLIQEKFAADHATGSHATGDVIAWLGKESSIAGTPHGQRSEGHIQVELKTPLADMRFIETAIQALEDALATPVQTAVKREDEQEFARLNAANLMFAEDAARRMHEAITGSSNFVGTAVEACHLESLHPHNAVAKVASGSLVKTAWM